MKPRLLDTELRLLRQYGALRQPMLTAIIDELLLARAVVAAADDVKAMNHDEWAQGEALDHMNEMLSVYHK